MEVINSKYFKSYSINDCEISYDYSDVENGLDYVSLKVIVGKNKEKMADYECSHGTIESKIEIRGGIGNKVLCSYNISEHKNGVKNNEKIPTLKENTEYPSIHFNSVTVDNIDNKEKEEENQFKPVSYSKDDDGLSKYYKTKFKHHFIIFIMGFIYNEKICDWLTDMIYKDRLEELKS